MQRGRVGGGDQLGAGDRARADRRCDAPGACQPVTRPLDHPRRTLRSENELGPSGRRRHHAVRVGRRLERPSHRGADGDHPAARGPRRVHEPGGGGRHREALGQRRFAGLRRRDAGMQRDRRERNPASDQVERRCSPVNGRPALGISALPGSPGEHRLVRAERVRARVRRRSGSAGRPGSGTPCTPPSTATLARQSRARAMPAGYGASSDSRTPSGSSTDVATAASGTGPVAGPVGRTSTSQIAVVQRGREVDGHRRAVTAQPVHRGGERGRGVDHEQVTRRQIPREVGKACVVETVPRRHQAGAPRRAVPAARSPRARPAERTRRSCSSVYLGRAREARSGACGAAAKSPSDFVGCESWGASCEVRGSVAAARRSRVEQAQQRRHRRLAARDGRRCPRPGTPADASAVRMSPGSNGVHAHAGLLGAEDRAQLVERGLARPVAAPARVRLDCRVGADVDDHAACAHRSAGSTAESAPAARARWSRTPGAARRAGSRPRARQRARPERAGVVDEQVEPAEPVDRRGQRQRDARGRSRRRASRRAPGKSVVTACSGPASARGRRPAATRSRRARGPARGRNPRDAPVMSAFGICRPLLAVNVLRLHTCS